MERLLKVRAEIKKKKPNFIRSDYNKFRRFKKKWKKAKGRDNKIRRRIKGFVPHPSYGSPRKVRGMHPSGLFEKLVYNVNDLDNVDPKKYAIRIAKIGNRKKIDVVEKATKMKFKILNPKVKEKEKKVVKKKEKSKGKVKAEKKAEEKPKEEKKEEPKKEGKKNKKVKK